MHFNLFLEMIIEAKLHDDLPRNLLNPIKKTESIANLGKHFKTIT